MPKEIGGRGQIYFVSDGNKRFVIRHFVRGGMAAKFSYDAYIWKGAEQTRSFKEWRLIKEARRAKFTRTNTCSCLLYKKEAYFIEQIFSLKRLQG